METLDDWMLAFVMWCFNVKFCFDDKGDQARALEVDKEFLQSDGLAAYTQAGKLLADHLWKLIQSAEIEQDALLELGAKVAKDPRMHPARRSKVSHLIKEKAAEATDRMDELTENTTPDAAV